MWVRATAFFLFILATPMLSETRLIMVEETGCMWCTSWNEKIGPIYPKTPEGRTAPLQRIDIHETLPSDLTFSSSLQFTPTFVLMINGTEAARIEGYPGEGFFWQLLAQMITDAKIPWVE
jgi:hypothetical protein